MGTILDYLKKYGGYTLEEKPLGDVDSLILSQFAYLKFDGLAPSPDRERPPISMRELREHPDYDRLYADERYRHDNTALFQAMLASRRFRDLRVYNYVNQIDLQTETQFCAMIFRLPNGLCYVAYRGTDETIVGWKEDLNLAFSEPVAGQRMSVEYLNRAAEEIRGDFCVGGHSKGGNLATYACMNCKPEVRRRVTAVYDHDGPGFRPEVRAHSAYEEIAGRIHKTVPHSSLVGMLLYTDGSYSVVESKTAGLAQHNPFTWLVKGDGFKLVDNLYAGRRFVDDSLNQWILSLTQEELHAFVDTFYRIALASETDNLIDFTANWMQSVPRIAAALKEIEPGTAEVITKMLKSFFEILSVNAKAKLKGGKHG